MAVDRRTGVIRTVTPQPVDRVRHRLRRGTRSGRPPGFDPSSSRIDRQR
ncbi:hypothetical protein BX281_1673 [Streptomyces sp. Ag82_O1-15]|nr:hypothetical protein BX281_1673 [Streptomyces sp. Ag82_O1-15]